MRLTRYRVTGFRSVEDSGWIELDIVGALIGENESGKTNLILPLWKFNPARDGAIDLVADSPRKRFTEIRAAKEKPVFITVELRLTDEFAAEIAALTGAPTSSVAVVEVGRRFDGNYVVRFPADVPRRSVPTEDLRRIIAAAIFDMKAADPLRSETETVDSLGIKLATAVSDLATVAEDADLGRIDGVVVLLTEARRVLTRPTSAIAPLLDRLIGELDALKKSVDRAPASDSAEAKNRVIAKLPKFVYYASYGNLDSEIYLPHVIENMSRPDLGQREAAKARTLKVLFEFVGVSPKEILELGRETVPTTGTQLTSEQVAADAKRKQEREVLLQSAGAKLTREFREWWKRGNYQFRFQADGNHFRIWVSDDLRPEDIELENRSTGLQWFLSFYLVFLVESRGAHANAILLLDEPGHSLHPLAQRDLSAFFQGLAATNQLQYTTHSPFLVDPDHLDRVKAVYVDASGVTRCSPDLRASERVSGKRSSVYPVYAAVGISVCDVLLLGCQVVLVEGVSDQFLFSALKNILTAQGKLAPARELVFVPGSGVKSIKPITSVIAGPTEELPIVVVDGDEAGHAMAKTLRGDLYANRQHHVIVLSDVTGRPGDEVEDLFLPSAYGDAVDRFLKVRDADFASTIDPAMPITPQVEQFATANAIDLPKPGWKVEVAKLLKERMVRASPGLPFLDDRRLSVVEDLFKRLVK